MKSAPALMPEPTLHIAIPAMNEAEWLPSTIRHILQEYTPNTHIWVCVNQPESYHQDPAQEPICENNARTLNYLGGLGVSNLHILDHSSPGKGWTGKRQGVGQARKTLMDSIVREADAHDLIVSMDADTLFDPGYLESIQACFRRHPEAVALSNPYYHCLTGTTDLDRAMLRYEIYMRHYAINMWRIGSPYSFTALGSAIAVPVHAYRKAGGMTAKKSGEDFYFLQKLRKTGWICNHNTHKVYPGTRYSDRVFFGTGPALIKGSRGDWDSYPIYSHELFDQVGETIRRYAELYEGSVETPMSAFLRTQFREDDPFEPLRRNAAGQARFLQACHEKIDGLRQLQFLKSSSRTTNTPDEAMLLRFFETHAPALLVPGKESTNKKAFFNRDELAGMRNLDFARSPLPLLDKIRNALAQIEVTYQEKDASRRGVE